jgi:tetratricopeptide (TPR) repeat protein
MPLVAARHRPGAAPAHRPTAKLIAAGVVLCGVAAVVAGRWSGVAGAVTPSATQVAALSSGAPQPSSGAREVQLVPDAAIAAIDASRAGIAAYNSGDIAGSVQEFTTAVEANPENAAALNNLGQVLVRSGRPAEAIPYFDRAIGVSGATWSYHFNRARAYGEMNAWPQAIAGYREAARLFPEDYATQFNLAKALQANGDLPDAIDAFERAVALAPGQADFHLSHGFALEAAQRPRDAAAAYRRFLELEPSSPEAEKIKARISQLEGL